MEGSRYNNKRGRNEKDEMIGKRDNKRMEHEKKYENRSERDAVGGIERGSAGGNPGHVVVGVEKGSIAQELGIERGDVLLKINGQGIEDIFDYRFLTQDEYVEVLILKGGKEEWLFQVDKDEDEDLGLSFENGLMDEYRSCKNKCIFCFIDQMPPGMRETLYFKDDDSRLSFLQGNYVTLTNLSERDVERIIRYRLSPVNISFHTTNPQLRCQMLHNRFAGEALKKAERLYSAGIAMNGQIVLCKGINDGEELERSIRDLAEYAPVLQSVSVVPVGLSKYRDGLYPLEAFTREDAVRVIRMVQEWQGRMYREHRLHFIHCSDEWYLMADMELPEEERYDGYLQLENGVGMLRLFMEEVDEALLSFREKGGRKAVKKEKLSLATGILAEPYIREAARRFQDCCPEKELYVYLIRNDFFGERITVSGLLTGRDILAQLAKKELGERLLLPENVLRSGERVFLDDMTVEELEKSLQVKIDIVESSGWDFIEKLKGE